jgi:hypothetical protein
MKLSVILEIVNHKSLLLNEAQSKLERALIIEANFKSLLFHYMIYKITI